MRKIITRTILLLSLVSFFNDISSEMLFPVMPVFLQSIGFSTVFIGILEGLAEAVAGISKIYFGRLSDLSPRRMPLVRFGYLLSTFSKPMLAFFNYTWWVFTSRTLDRLGKGIRTGARDALLSDETKPGHKGTVFGFHRAMDTAGAAIGPIAALFYLQFHPGDYKTLFLIAFFPSLLGVLLTFLIKEKAKEKAPKKINSSPAKSFFYWKQAPPAFRQLMTGLLFFGIMNSSDAFLLLRAKAVSGEDSTVLIAYIFYNLVYALFAFPLGRVADRIGMKKMIIGGLILFAMVYGGMAVAQSVFFIGTLFFLYGIYAAATEGIFKALVSDLVPATETASAIGFYSGWNSICVLIASSATGWLWYVASPQVAFMASAGGSLLTAFYLAATKLHAAEEKGDA